MIDSREHGPSARVEMSCLRFLAFNGSVRMDCSLNWYVFDEVYSPSGLQWQVGEKMSKLGPITSKPAMGNSWKLAKTALINGARTLLRLRCCK